MMRAKVVTILVAALAVSGSVIPTALVLGSPEDAGTPKAPTARAGHEPDASTGAGRLATGTGSTPDPASYSAPTAERLALLPEARHDAVIPALMDESDAVAPRPVPPGPAPSTGGSVVDYPTTAFALLADAPLYGADRVTPVARMAAVNFLGEPSVVVPVASDGEWTRVLTPARQQLPSTAGGRAAAQSSGWMRTDSLVHPVPILERIAVSVSAQTLTIVSGDHLVSAFDVGVGTPNTPTPHGVTGYLQARYLDPAQGQSRHRVQLTSLHSSTADEPYGGTDGGLIGIHHSTDAAGSVSHGCIRLSDAAIRAVDALPLGTPITVLE